MRSTPAGVRWARKHGLPCVETYHTLFEEYFHHYLPFLPKAWLAAAARMISRKECDGVSAVIAPSSAMKDTLEAYGVASSIHVIPTGLKPAEFADCDGPAFRARHGIAPERPVMAYVGRVPFEKNLDFLLRVTEQVRPRLPDALLVIAGEGPARVALERSVAKRGLAAHVKFVGYLERRTELPACYCAADAFVFASKTKTQGLVLLEAMALGVPVVGLAVIGHPGRAQGRRGLPHRAGRRCRIRRGAGAALGRPRIGAGARCGRQGLRGDVERGAHGRGRGRAVPGAASRAGGRAGVCPGIIAG
jgi:glycosyltransferase involved in cell wall biosynthesis